MPFCARIISQKSNYVPDGGLPPGILIRRRCTMFDEIGNKIKTVAQVFTWIGIVGSVIWGFVVMGSNVDNAVLFGILIIAIGSLVSWLGSLTLYGFGQLIENTDELVKQRKQNTVNPVENSNRHLELKDCAPIFSDSQKVKIGAENKSVSVENHKKKYVPQDHIPVPVGTLKVKCLVCGEEQPSNREVCWTCGSRFIK